MRTLNVVAILSLSICGALACSDTTAPRFDGEAELTGTIADGALELAWSAASDDREDALKYEIAIGDMVELETRERSHQFASNRFNEAEALVISLVATDAAGNRSAPLVLETTAPDTTGPRWSAAPQIMSRAVNDGDKQSYRWTAANDASGVERYELSVDGKQVYAGSDTTWTGVAGENVSVIAYDAFNNASSPLKPTAQKTSPAEVVDFKPPVDVVAKTIRDFDAQNLVRLKDAIRNGQIKVPSVRPGSADHVKSLQVPKR